MSAPDDRTTQLAAADAAAAAGNLAEAASLIEAALAGEDIGPAVWLRLAGLRRALRQPRRALDAVHKALAHAPFDFVALSLRAGLLEKLEPEHAGEAWAEALAQRPQGALPQGMMASVVHGEALRDGWLAGRADRFAEAAEASETAADADAAWKIARFRSNVLRQTRVWHSEPTHYHFPGLVEREYHPRARFPWLAELEAATAVVRAEMQHAIASTRAELVPYIEYGEHEALAQWRPLNHSADWTALHLLRKGAVVEANAALCPQTMALLARLPQPKIAGASPNAMFSLLAPHTAIPPHVGVNNARLVCHLPLVVPAGCWFRVGGETREWREGAAFVFDDTVEHEAMNPSDALRVVLIFDVWHPDLGEAEQQAVAAVIAADGGLDGGL
ncbi:aspartyl/asparaginyl beta-hydroxylase domain-containing protein [Novosphingobium sp.]|uniref:aspartyl/asparaginyl beta-hydroxylase domain-containing protein n=1 Tax=Novosphingobium sp. TaxID=1874826 RepID=UPI00286C75FB|nr:aspartyl/asparaginyl beta-hydroxylase domain-containing protein [Novosphingobium sp.]